jgi:uncharacterized protein (UPF0261 family)
MLGTGKVILILVMAEEKWEEADFLRSEIESLGHKARILDMGLVGEAKGRCDITREEVMGSSGNTPEEIALISNRGNRMPVVIKGGIKKVREIFSTGEIAGIISLGGTTGTRIGTSIMKALPFGVPKLAVSSTASLPGFASRSIGTADLTLMHSVIEIAGLNDILRNALVRAAGAICGMVEGSTRAPVFPSLEAVKPLIAMTHFGICEECAVNVRKRLEQKGYQVIGFSASGIGDRAMEEIIEKQNIFCAVIDLAPGGVGEELFGFSRAAGPTRLEAAGKMGILQIVAPSGVNLGSPLKRKYKPEYETRKKFDYDSSRTFLRLSKKEIIMVARVFAEKLNKAKGEVRLLIPLRGWSSLDREGSPLYDPETDKIFTDELRKYLRPEIEIKEVEANIDDLEFSEEVVSTFKTIKLKDNRKAGGRKDV